MNKRTRHGESKSLTYSTWRNMKSRIKASHRPEWACYANVDMDPRWSQYLEFLKDMGERPGKEYSIDRIDATKGYNKDNCRWITISENSRRANTTHGRSGTKEYLAEWRITNRERMLNTMKQYDKKRKLCKNQKH